MRCNEGLEIIDENQQYYESLYKTKYVGCQTKNISEVAEVALHVVLS